MNNFVLLFPSAGGIGGAAPDVAAIPDSLPANLRAAVTRRPGLALSCFLRFLAVSGRPRSAAFCRVACLWLTDALLARLVNSGSAGFLGAAGVASGTSRSALFPAAARSVVLFFSLTPVAQRRDQAGKQNNCSLRFGGFMETADVVLFLAGLFASYFAGVKVGVVVRLIKDIGNSA